MEKRYYFEIAGTTATEIASLERIFTTSDNITTISGYKINNVNYNLSQPYTTVFPLPPDTNQPFMNVIGEANGREVWTKDGLYLHKGITENAGNIQVYVKDLLENVPDSYQSKMINDIMGDKAKLDGVATHLLNNTISPKEFDVIYNSNGTSTQEGIQEQIIAITTENLIKYYYINSPNDYGEYGSNNIYGSMWKIPSDIYETFVESVDSGMNKNMILRSNKLVYLMKYEGMGNDTSPYLNGGSGLIYLKTIKIQDVWYQIYINTKFIYNTSGELPSNLSSEWQTILIENVFSNSDLRGKVIKVW